MAVSAVSCTGSRSSMSREMLRHTEWRWRTIQSKGKECWAGKHHLKNVIPAALSELEALRNVSQVVMEKSLPRFLQTEEQSISANRLKQTILLSAEGWKYNRWVRNNFSSPFFFSPAQFVSLPSWVITLFYLPAPTDYRQRTSKITSKLPSSTNDVVIPISHM